MFNYEDEYRKATEDAMVNTYEKKQYFNWKALFLNSILLSAFATLGYFSFIYLKEEPTILTHKTTVMGISHTISDEEYAERLNKIYSDELEEDISDALSSIVNTSTLRDDSLYTQAISQEIDGKYHENSRVILVEKGDTLASISEAYYGNSMEFNKIIEANEHLSEESNIIHIGQKLNVPY